MTTHLLAGLRVLDMSDRHAFDCGRFLATLGAEVIRVDLPGTVEDTLWSIGNRGKKSVCIDYRDRGEGREILKRMIAECDILIESFHPEDLEELELEYASLAVDHPRLIHVSITPFGRAGPYAAWRGGELVVAALASTLDSMGTPDRPPVKEPLEANFFHACGAAAAGAMFALIERDRSGIGQHVDISAQECGAGRNTVWTMLYQFDGKAQKRGGQFMNLGMGANRMIWELQDGWATFSAGPPRSPVHVALADWKAERGVDPNIGNEDFFATISVEEALEEAIPRGIPLMPILSPPEVARDPHLIERGYFPRETNGEPGRWFVHVEGAE